MSNDLVETKQERQAPAPVAFGDAGVQLRSLEDAFRFARAVQTSGMAPTAYRSPEAVLVAMQTGMELGYSPMQAIRNMWPGPDGRPNEYVEASWSRVLASGLVEDWSEEVSDTTANFRVKRRGMPTAHVSTYTIDDARRAGLVKSGSNWEKHLRRMLLARAKGFALKDAFADVLKGMAIAEVRDEFGQAPDRARDVTPPATPDPIMKMLTATDHVGAELGLPPAPEPQLLSPDGEVLTADQAGLAQFKDIWLAHLDRIDIEQSGALADAERAIAAAKELLAAKPKMVAWLEGLAMQCRAKVTAPQ